MKKRNSCSFYFITQIISKKYFLFVSLAVIFIINGFFISTAYAETIVTDDILADTVWSVEGSPYILYNNIFIDKDITLTIDKGVIVKVEPGYMGINSMGKIVADGTLDEPIYFTSNYDDTVGGSTDNDEYYCDFVDYDDEGNPIGDEVCEYFDYFEPSVDDWDGIYISDSTGSSFKNVFLKYSDGAVNLYSSGADFENINIKDSSSGITIYENSNANILNGNFSNIDDGITLFNNSHLNIKNISLYCNKSGITVFNDSSLNIVGGEISCIENGITLFNRVNADITGIKISDSENEGIIAFGNRDTDIIKFTKSEIMANNYGFVVFNSPIYVNQNSIHGNMTKGANTFPVYDRDTDTTIYRDIDFTNNYWGDKSGPTHTLNLNGIGDIISDNILFAPFLKTDPLQNVRNPVILIPGITGTYLNRNYGDKSEIWPNLGNVIFSPFDLFLKDLSLNKEGIEKIEYPIIIGDIIRGIPSIGIDVFDNLIERFTNAGYIEGVDLFVFPYDWRFSTENTSKLLKEKIDKVLMETTQEKVDIIAHSMGGLVAKKYIADIGEDKIDQLVFLGTPQLGSPKAFKTLMFGDSMGYEKFNIPLLRPIIAKEISQNMPSVYELLPSQKYIQENGSYVVDAMREISLPGSSFSLDYERTKSLMLEKGRNSLMFPFAENLHNSIDDLDLSGIRSYNFVGCGSKTIGEITVKQERAWEKLWLGFKDDYNLKYVDGDSTVPLVSANKTIGGEVYYVNKVSHGSLPADSSVIGGILAFLNNGSIEFDDTLKDNNSDCGISGDVVSIHSPAELHIYDEEGNHTGPDKNGDIEYGIDGVEYDMLGGVKYAFLPDGVNYKIVTNATDTGGYNFKIEEQDKDDNIINTYDWTLVPLATLDTKGEIWIGPDYPADQYEVKIDVDGNGTFDKEYSESYNGTKEAEKIIEKSKKHKSSGSMSIFRPKEDKNKKEDIFEKYKEENKERIVFNKNKIKISENTKDDDFHNKKNNLYASVGVINFKINYIWPISIFTGLLLIILAKKFIKL